MTTPEALALDAAVKAYHRAIGTDQEQHARRALLRLTSLLAAQQRTMPR